MRYYVIVTPDIGKSVAFVVSTHDRTEALMIALLRAKDQGIIATGVRIAYIIY